MSEANLATTAEIVKAYLANNTIEADAIPALLRKIHAELNDLANGAPVAEQPATSELQSAAAAAAPAVSVKKSVTPDYLICLDCAKPVKILKRHLAAIHGLTPRAYRERWNLSRDYPMAAPNYSEYRSQMSKALGLGRKPKADA